MSVSDFGRSDSELPEDQCRILKNPTRSFLNMPVSDFEKSDSEFSKHASVGF